METNRDDFSIALRSALLKKGAQQRFSLFGLIVLSIILLVIETIETKPLNYLRSFIKDGIYRGASIATKPKEGAEFLKIKISSHFNTYSENEKLREEINKLKNLNFSSEFLKSENVRMKNLLMEEINPEYQTITSKVLLDKESPYLKSIIINKGQNFDLKKGMPVLDRNYLIGRIVETNFFSSRVLLLTDLNSRIPVIIEPRSYHAILSGGLENFSSLDFLPKNYELSEGDKVYTSGKDGIFYPGIPVGKITFKDTKPVVDFFSDFNQASFVKILTNKLEPNEDQ